MGRPLRILPPSFCRIDTTTYSVAFQGLLFVMLVVAMAVPTPHHGTGVDLPKVSHPVLMRGAEREDALIVGVMKDGKVYFGNDRFSVDLLAAKLRERLKHTGQRKVYVRADARARFGTVREVADQISRAGLTNMAFLTDQRKPTASAIPHPTPDSTQAR